MTKATKKVSINVPKGRPGLTPDSRDAQLCSLAVNLAEQQLRDGTASSQVITHYLKLASANRQSELEKEELLLEKQRLENELLKAKTDAIQSAKRIEDLYAKAMQAFTGYGANCFSNNNDYEEVDEYVFLDD